MREGEQDIQDRKRQDGHDKIMNKLWYKQEII
jgi:hypothetical protein